MFENSNTIPCLRMQPTSMLFSMNGDPLSRRELFGYGFIMLCCEDWDIDYSQCSVYTTETLEKHLERVVRPNGSFLDSTELSELSGLHWVSCWDITLSPEQRTALLCGYFRFGITMGKFLARDSDESPICVVDVLRGGERLKVYNWFPSQRRFLRKCVLCHHLPDIQELLLSGLRSLSALRWACGSDYDCRALQFLPLPLR